MCDTDIVAMHEGRVPSARAARVARATLYVHFPTRETLIATISDRAVAVANELLRDVRLADGDPAAALERALRTGGPDVRAAGCGERDRPAAAAALESGVCQWVDTW